MKMTHKNAGKYNDEVMMKPTTILPESHDASDGADDDGGNFMLNNNDDNADDDGDADEHA